jgi:uncharacterized protein with NAD-binding domain and iron-sulfur cluster
VCTCLKARPQGLSPRGLLPGRHTRASPPRKKNLIQDQYAPERGSVLEFDLYHAENLLPCSDEDVIARLTGSYLAAALPRGAAEGARVEDAAVLRFRGAATLFSPGSEAALPRICSGVGNVFVAGDAVAQGPGTHGSKGLSQEKAYVSGLQVGPGQGQGLLRA